MREFLVFLFALVIMIITILLSQLLSVQLGGRNFAEYWIGNGWLRIVGGTLLFSGMFTLATWLVMGANDRSAHAAAGAPDSLNIAQLITGMVICGLTVILFSFSMIPHEVGRAFQSVTEFSVETSYEDPLLVKVETPTSDLPIAEYENLKIEDLGVQGSFAGGNTGVFVLQIEVNKTNAANGIPIPKNRPFKGSKIWFRSASDLETKTMSF